MTETIILTMVSTYGDSFLITAFIMALFWGVTVVTVVLVMMRRRRLPHYYTPILGRTLSGRRIGHKIRPNLKPHPILAHLRPPIEDVLAQDLTEPEHSRPHIPVCVLDSDQVAIHIEPDDSLSQEHQTIQRVIEYLKRSPEAETWIAG